MAIVQRREHPRLDRVHIDALYSVGPRRELALQGAASRARGMARVSAWARRRAADKERTTSRTLTPGSPAARGARPP